MKKLTILSALAAAMLIISPAYALFGGKDKEDDKQAKAPITSCGAPGDVCSDGTLFIGLYCPDEGKNMRTCSRLFTVPYDQAELITWKPRKFKDDIKNDSSKDGESNIGQANPINDYPAMQRCKNLDYADYDDWYLPAIKELNHLFKYRGIIGNFSAQNYWSSSEGGDRTVWVQSFANGATNQQGKNQKLNVRCIRQEKVHAVD